MISDTNIRINRDLCYACGICVDRCIMDNLSLSAAPCRQECPLNLNCQGYIRLIAQGKEEEAAQELRKYTPFGAILGRVCSRPCEAACERDRNFNDGAVHIRALKRYLADTYPDITASRPAETKPNSGHKAAVIGSGPAGLMAAYQLSADGHHVTVFEAEDKPGGFLRHAIPSFRLPVEVVDRAVDYLKAMGVAFKTGHAVGREISFEELDAYDAVMVAFGQQVDPGGLPADLIDKDAGILSADALTLQASSRENVFIFGDCRTGPFSVVHAMAAGKEAAISADRFLKGESLGYGRDYYTNNGLVRDYEVSTRQCTGGPRGKVDRLPVSERSNTDETVQTMTQEQARKEAERCLSCGRSFESNRTCWYCLPCEIECPVDALEVRMPYQVR